MTTVITFFMKKRRWNRKVSPLWERPPLLARLQAFDGQDAAAKRIEPARLLRGGQGVQPEESVSRAEFSVHPCFSGLHVTVEGSGSGCREFRGVSQLRAAEQPERDWQNQNAVSNHHQYMRKEAAVRLTPHAMSAGPRGLVVPVSPVWTSGVSLAAPRPQSH